jgi:DNA-binding LacI/PurR family transcriptional regulator
LLGLGHRRIAFIGGPTLPGAAPINRVYTVEQRVIGYWTALHEAGIPIDDKLFASCNMTTAGAYTACQQLLVRAVPFSAIICANDESAIGATKALRAAGLRMPEDVSIVGFDDIDMAEHLTPALTTVRIHKRAIGTMAVKTLIARAQDPAALPIMILLPTELIVRGSTGIVS